MKREDALDPGQRRSVSLRPEIHPNPIQEADRAKRGHRKEEVGSANLAQLVLHASRGEKGHTR